MSRFIKKMFVGSLSLSESLASIVTVAGLTKCMSLNVHD